MNYILFISWISAAFSFTVLAAGFYIFLKDIKNRINIMFFMICLIASFLLLFLNLQHFINNKAYFLVIYNIILFLSYIFLPVNIHFYLELTKGKKLNNYKIIIIYFVSFLMYILSLIYKFPFSEFIRIENKYWKFIHSDNFGFHLYIIFSFLYHSYCLVILIKWRIKSSLIRNKKQASALITSIIIFIIIGCIAFLLFPFYHNSELFPLALIISILVYVFAILYALLRYSFLSIDNKKMLEEVLSHIEEFVFLLNAKSGIIQTNSTVKDIFFKNKDDMSYLNLVNNNEELKEILNNIINRKADRVNVSISYKIKDEIIITDSYISRIEDKYKDIVAILVLSKENMNIEIFKNIYKITNKELEIINYTKLGSSVKEIAAKLQISARTVEAHYINIYAKLNIKNKIELINLINQYL